MKLPFGIDLFNPLTCSVRIPGAGPLDLLDDGCCDGGLGRLWGFEREQVSVLEEPERGGRCEPGGGVGRQGRQRRGGGDGGEEEGGGEGVEGPGVGGDGAGVPGAGGGGVEVHVLVPGGGGGEQEEDLKTSGDGDGGRGEGDDEPEPGPGVVDGGGTVPCGGGGSNVEIGRAHV